jgi:hypothetical protein
MFFYYRRLHWILTTIYTSKGPMEKNYKILSTYQISNHISHKQKKWFLRMSFNNVNTLRLKNFNSKEKMYVQVITP